MGYDLEERTFQFAIAVRALSRALPIDIANREDLRQIVRSSGSIGANYIEADDGLSRADFAYRIKVSKKEANESIYWLRLLAESNPSNRQDILALTNEAEELMKIFGAILRKTEG